MPRKKPLKGQGELDFKKLTADERSYLKVALKAAAAEDTRWRGMFAVPAGTLLDDVIEQFRSRTNIPLEVPFVTFLHYLAAWLLAQDVRVEVTNLNDPQAAARTIGMDFWTVVLAASGAGKTWTQRELASGLGEVAPRIGGAVSAAAFIDELDQAPRALWIRDEFLQLLKAIEKPGNPMEEVKDYLLRIYDNEPIQRTTKKYDIRIDEPALSILGFNVDATFVNGMTPESLVDGFAQRFGYIFAQADPGRPWQKYPIWSVNNTAWREKWTRMTAGILPRYRADESAVGTFNEMFTSLAGDVEESYFRRVLWRAHKYALLYHIICERGGEEVLTQTDYAWAHRLISMQLADAAKLISATSSSDLGKLVDKAEALRDKYAAQGKTITARALVQNVRGIRNAAEAKFVMDVLAVATVKTSVATPKKEKV